MFEFLDKLKTTVTKTAQSLIGNVVDTVSEEEEFSDLVLDDMEDMLISADIGVGYASELTDKLRSQTKIKPSQVKEYLKSEFLKTLTESGSCELNYVTGKLNIYFITGVNGAGKTTLIGKLAYMFTSQGKKVLVAAGDTYRAAAEEQADIWSKRANADILRRDKADPASVVYEAIQKAKNENYDVVLIDTAGRLQNKVNLMNELEKINKVIARLIPNAPHETLLVIDAATGQNGILQAEAFKSITNVTGIVLTKMDGTAKGGIVLAIKESVGLPVKFIGLGEGLDDLENFDIENYIYGLFKDLIKDE